MKEKIIEVLKFLNKGLVDKESVMKLGLLALLAKENIVLLGPPGTAKSEVSRRLSEVIDGGNYFEYLLTKYTTPEEIFGPLSIKSLKNDEFHRNVEGYMPKSTVVFLDEVFKANSSILNSLLTIINEKKYHNGKEKIDVPLISLIGASNEYPENGELDALYDRFLIKKNVGYISDIKRDKLFDITNEKMCIPKELKFTVSEIKKIENEYKKVEIPENMRKILKLILKRYEIMTKDDKNEKISDRKIVKISKLLKISAYTNGRNTIDESDIFLLKDCLWNDVKYYQKLVKIIDIEVRKEV